MGIQTLRVTNTAAPLVLVTCRECQCSISAEHCPTCQDEGAVWVDEVFEADEILDPESWEVHSAWWDQIIAARNAA